MALGVPPYDLIIWLVLFFVVLPFGACCACLCCGAREKSLPRRFLRFAQMASAWLMITLVLVVVIFAAMSSTLGGMFFEPKPASECVASCEYTNRDGLVGWTDQTCCTYAQNQTQRDVWLRTEQGYVVHGWLMVNTTLAQPGQQRLAVLYNHGSGGNIGMAYRHVRYGDILALGNVAVFAYDYAGFGKSTEGVDADPTVIMQSAAAAAFWFAQWEASWDTTTPQFGSSASPLTAGPVARGSVDMSNIVLLGRSMGGYVSTWLGSEVADWRVRSLVLQSTLGSTSELWQTFFPVVGWAVASELLESFAEFDNPRFIAGYAGCVYQYASEADEWAPYENAKSTWAGALSKDPSCSEFVSVTDAKHTQPLTAEGLRTVTAFLNRARTVPAGRRAIPTPDQKSRGSIIAGPVVGIVVGIVVAVALIVALHVLDLKYFRDADTTGSNDNGNGNGPDAGEPAVVTNNV